MASVDTIPKQQPSPSQRHRRPLDLALGIALGLILGIAVIFVFVFYGSEGSVDAPRISGSNTGASAQRAMAGSAAPAIMETRHPRSAP